MAKLQSDTYNFVAPAEYFAPKESFFNIKGLDLQRNREEPFRSVTYFNLVRNIGTIDWHTGIPIDENAIPKYFVDRENNYIPNPEYRGEVFFPEMEPSLPSSETNTATGVFRPNSVTIEVNIREPGILVVNQNYHRDWHTNIGELFE